MQAVNIVSSNDTEAQMAKSDKPDGDVTGFKRGNYQDVNRKHGLKATNKTAGVFNQQFACVFRSFP